MHPPRMGLALLACLVLSACSPSTPPTTKVSSSTNVPTCTPEFGGEPFPCTPAEFEAQQKLDARYAEAERVFRRNAELENEMYHARTGSVSPEAAALHDPDGPYAAHLAKVARVAQEIEFAGDFRVVSVVRAALDQNDAPGTIGLVACIDGSETSFTLASGKVESGSSGAKKLVFTESTATKIWNSYTAEEASC